MIRLAASKGHSLFGIHLNKTTTWECACSQIHALLDLIAFGKQNFSISTILHFKDKIKIPENHLYQMFSLILLKCYLIK